MRLLGLADRRARQEERRLVARIVEAKSTPEYDLIVGSSSPAACALSAGALDASWRRVGVEDNPMN
jgi:hypothetical protein